MLQVNDVILPGARIKLHPDSAGSNGGVQDDRYLTDRHYQITDHELLKEHQDNGGPAPQPVQTEWDVSGSGYGFKFYGNRPHTGIH